nr:putative uncharacterized protein LRRC75A-AS1, mitochondrial [Pan troglodytes]
MEGVTFSFPLLWRATSARAWSLRRPGPGSPAHRGGGVQTRENWIAYPLQSAEDGVATRLQIREESASCLAAEYWSQEPAMRLYSQRMSVPRTSSCHQFGF